MEHNERQPPHPGMVLQKEFLEPLGLSQNKLALALHVPSRRINEIVLLKRGITADTALRLSKCLGTQPEFWMNLQSWRRRGKPLAKEIRPISLERQEKADGAAD